MRCVRFDITAAFDAMRFVNSRSHGKEDNSNNGPVKAISYCGEFANFNEAE
jgi:hypothetical protein